MKRIWNSDYFAQIMWLFILGCLFLMARSVQECATITILYSFGMMSGMACASAHSWQTRQEGRWNKLAAYITEGAISALYVGALCLVLYGVSLAYYGGGLVYNQMVLPAGLGFCLAAFEIGHSQTVSKSCQA